MYPTKQCLEAQSPSKVTSVTQAVELSRFGAAPGSSSNLYGSGCFERDEWSVRQLAQCRSGDSPYLVVKGFSELLVKLEISLTLSGEIDNSNVKEVEEVSR
jgi:hypothetical protein